MSAGKGRGKVAGRKEQSPHRQDLKGQSLVLERPNGSEMFVDLSLLLRKCERRNSSQLFTGEHNSD